MSDETIFRPRVVVCAAIRKDGICIIGPRHFDMVMHDQIGWIGKLHPTFFWGDADQGFIDQWGCFMTREQALQVAKAAGQIKRKTGPDNLLFSEDIY